MIGDDEDPPPEFDDDTWEEPDEHRAAVDRLTRDLIIASRIMSASEARFLVDSYYTIQDQRKRANSQRLALDKGADVKGKHPEPHLLLDWVFDQSKILEAQIKRALLQYSQNHLMGDWCLRVTGIGPVITSGLVANLETPRVTAGKIYAFAGIAGRDQKKWEAGELRPWSRRMKVLQWHCGQSFMKLQNHPDCFYGKLYKDRKFFEQHMSDTGQRTETAKEALPKLKRKNTTTYKWYSEGKLPPSQIDGRARRHAVKIFLSHFNEVWNTRLGNPIVAPYALNKLGHRTYIPPPFW